MKLAWYVAQTVPGWEKRARKDLDERVGVSTWLPMVEETIVKRGVKVATARPLMEGYLFVFFDKDDRDQWSDVCKAIGVYQLLPSNAWPAKLDSGWMETFQAAVAADGLFHITKDEQPWLFQVGKYIRVPEGPFASFGGLCTEANSKEIVVQVNIFGRFTPVTLQQAVISKEDVFDTFPEEHVVKSKMFGYKRRRNRTAI